MDIVEIIDGYAMQTANLILVYAWAGWAFIMLPSLAVLLATGWAIKAAANKVAENMMLLYRLSTMQYYFHKMEKNGTHSLRKEAYKPMPDQKSNN